MQFLQRLQEYAKHFIEIFKHDFQNIEIIFKFHDIMRNFVIKTTISIRFDEIFNRALFFVLINVAIKTNVFILSKR